MMNMRQMTCFLQRRKKEENDDDVLSFSHDKKRKRKEEREMEEEEEEEEGAVFIGKLLQHFGVFGKVPRRWQPQGVTNR